MLGIYNYSSDWIELRQEFSRVDNDESEEDSSHVCEGNGDVCAGGNSVLP